MFRKINDIKHLGKKGVSSKLVVKCMRCDQHTHKNYPQELTLSIRSLVLFSGKEILLRLLYGLIAQVKWKLQLTSGRKEATLALKPKLQHLICLLNFSDEYAATNQPSRSNPTHPGEQNTIERNGQSCIVHLCYVCHVKLP